MLGNIQLDMFGMLYTHDALLMRIQSWALFMFSCNDHAFCLLNQLLYFTLNPTLHFKSICMQTKHTWLTVRIKIYEPVTKSNSNIAYKKRNILIHLIFALLGWHDIQMHMFKKMTNESISGAQCFVLE